MGGGEVQLYKYEHEKYNGNHFTHKWIKATRTRSAKCRMQNAARKMKNGKGGKGMKGGGGGSWCDRMPGLVWSIVSQLCIE